MNLRAGFSFILISLELHNLIYSGLTSWGEFPLCDSDLGHNFKSWTFSNYSVYIFVLFMVHVYLVKINKVIMYVFRFISPFSFCTFKYTVPYNAYLEGGFYFIAGQSL